MSQSADTGGDALERTRAHKIVNLALQGGGSHGAFTWGVLDRLLEEERLDFEGITATSAGAVNAVVMVDGLAAGGRKGAKEALRNYWQKVENYICEHTEAQFSHGICPECLDVALQPYRAELARRNGPPI